jgi:integrase
MARCPWVKLDGIGLDGTPRDRDASFWLSGTHRNRLGKAPTVTIRKEDRGGKPRLVIDILYQTADGKKHRFRRDAQIQTKYGAESEHRRLVAELVSAGTLERVNESRGAANVALPTFDDAVKLYRTTRLPRLKPSTRMSYVDRLEKSLIPRFGNELLEELNGESLAKLDAEMASDELAPSTRRNFHIVFRSVIRAAVDAGLLASMPKMPPLPKVGRKVTKPLRRSDLEAIMAKAPPNAQLACALAAFAGLRAGEVRGLRWPDVDLKIGTITIRRSITRNEESTPKSGNHDVLPIVASLGTLLEAALVKRKNPWAEVALTNKGQPWGESGLNQAFQRARDRAGLDTWSYHDLRHFFISELFRSGVPAHVVRALARHSDLDTTQRYADLDASDLRVAMDRLDGNGVNREKCEGSNAP